MSGASLTHLTYVNDGEPYFVRAGTAPIIFSTGSVLYSPVIVVPPQGQMVGPFVTTITNNQQGNATFGLTNSTTNNFETGLSIPTDDLVYIYNSNVSGLGIQSWTSNNTTITKPIIVNQSIGAAAFNITQGLDQLGFNTELYVDNNRNPATPIIRLYDAGNITMNSTITMTNTINVHDIGNNNNTNLESNGISGTTAAGIPWIVEQQDSVGGLVINADTNSGYPPNITAYNDGTTTIGSTIRFLRGGTGNGVISINDTNLQFANLTSYGLTGNNEISGHTWSIQELNTGAIAIESNTAIGEPLLINEFQDSFGTYQELSMGDNGSSIILRPGRGIVTNAAITFNSTVQITNNPGSYDIVSTPAIYIGSINSSPHTQYVYNTAYGVDGYTATSINWHLQSDDDNGITIHANTNNNLGPNIQALQTGQTIINSTVVFSAPIADNQVNFKQDNDTNGNYLSFGLSNDNTVDSPEIRMNKDSGNISINSTITFSNNPLPLMNINDISTQAASITSITGIVGKTGAGYNWQMNSTDSVGGITINANTINNLTPNIVAYQDGTTRINSSFNFTNSPIPIMRVTSLTSSTYMETYSAGLLGVTDDSTAWAIRSLNTTGIEINANRNNDEPPAILANPNGTTVINSTFIFGNQSTQNLTIAGGTVNNALILDNTGFTLNTTPMSLSLINASNPSSFTFVTNGSNVSTMNIFDNTVQVANLQTYPGSLIVNNQTAYNPGSEDYGGSQLTWNAVNPGGGSTEFINSYGTTATGGFNFYTGADGVAKENLSSLMTLNATSLSLASNVELMCSTIAVSSITVTSITVPGGGSIGVPTGTVTTYAGVTEPTGYLFCDGRSYSTGTYPGLYSVIGNTYGGDSSNFLVPDCVNRTIFGAISYAAPPFNVSVTSLTSATFPTGPWSANFTDYFYVNSSDKPLVPGYIIQTPVGSVYQIIGFYDYNGYNGLLYVDGPINYPANNTTMVIDPARNATSVSSADPGVTNGSDRLRQTTTDIAYHYHNGATGGGNTYNVEGGPLVAGNGVNTGPNNNLGTYVLYSGGTQTNANSSMNISPQRIYMNQIIKT